MNVSYDVTIGDLGRRSDRARGYRVRWTVARHRFERRFSTKLLADSFRSDLVKAARKGEPFDVSSGLPEVMARAKHGRTWFEHARAFAETKWPTAAAKTRRSIAEALTTLTVTLVEHHRGEPAQEELRKALNGWAFNPPAWAQEPDEDAAAALHWV